MVGGFKRNLYRASVKLCIVDGMVCRKGEIRRLRRRNVL